MRQLLNEHPIKGARRALYLNLSHDLRQEFNALENVDMRREKASEEESMFVVFFYP